VAGGVRVARVQIFSDGLPCWFSQLKLNRTPSFLLSNRDAVMQAPSSLNLSDFQLYQVAGSKFAVYCQIEEGKASFIATQLESDSYCPNVLWFERALLSDDPALVPRLSTLE
jgi:hypothetical protein